MSKTVLMCLLIIVSNSAFAEWIYVDTTEGFDSYADKTTIRRNGNIVKMWILRDYKTVQQNANDAEGKAYFSLAFQQEHNCKAEQTRVLSLSYYSKNMGYGSAVYSQTFTSDWQPIVPSSIGQSNWRIACEVK